MNNKGRLKISSVLIAVNIVVLLVIVSFYGIRMYNAYKRENAVVNNEGETTFLSILKNKQSLVDLSQGLVFDEKTNTYSYKGKTEENYLYYSGIMFRIVGIDTAGNIKLVSNDNLTLMYSGLDKGFHDSYIYKWLYNNEEIEHSGVFEKLLYNSDELLLNNIICNDVISDLSSVECSEKNSEELFSLLSLYDYVTAGANESYLNNGESYYLNTFNDKSQNYYVSSTGEVGIDAVSTKIHGIRVVISLKSSIKLNSGSGTKSDPYRIESHSAKKLDDVYIGSIITFSKMNYIVVDKTDSTVKVVMEDTIKDGEDNLSKAFGGSSNKYSVSKNTVGAYLNDTFYNSLENKEYIVNSAWYNGANSMSNLDYEFKYNSSINANIGMLSLSELFVGDVANTLTISPGLESSNIIMTINDTCNVFGDSISTAYNIRPAFYLKNDLNISNGDGTSNNPFSITSESEISEVSKEEE